MSVMGMRVVPVRVSIRVGVALFWVNYCRRTKQFDSETYMMMSSHCEHAEKVYCKAKCTNKKQLVRIHLWGVETIFSYSQPSI